MLYLKITACDASTVFVSIQRHMRCVTMNQWKSTNYRFNVKRAVGYLLGKEYNVWIKLKIYFAIEY